MSADRWPLAPPALRAAPHAVLGAFCLGLATSLAWRVAPAPGLGLALAAGALGALGLARGRAGAAVAGLVLAVGLAGWALGAARVAGTAPPALDLPADARGTVVLDAPPAPDGFGGLRARAVGERLEAGGSEVPAGTRLLVELPRASGAPPPVGARLRVAGPLRAPAGTGDPAWWRAHLARQRIAARLVARSAETAGRRGGLAGLRDRWREWAGARVAAGVGGDRGALVRGMALGGGAGLSEGAAAAFRDAGLWHLLAVSGQNVTVVAIAALAALRGVGVGRRPAAGAAIGLIGAYCLACDGGASVARAGAVGALGLVAELRSAPRERWYLLLVALAALLAAQPRALGDPGLQLSFAAVAGLFAIAPPLRRGLGGWVPPRLADLVALAAAAALATAPVVVWHFGRLSLAGLALNVVAVPLAAPIVVLALAGLAAGAVLPAAGALAAQLAGLGAGVLLAMARGAAAVPGAAVDLPRAAAIGLLPAALAVPLVERRLRPGSPRPGGRGPRLRALAALAACGVVAVALLWRPAGPEPWPAEPAFSALDVGQGDALLLRSPDGAAALVDGGPPGAPAPVVAALRRVGVRRLDAVVMTHLSLDHIGGLADVVRAMPVGVVVHPPLQPGELRAPGRELLEAVRAAGVARRVVRAGAALRVGGWRLRVLWPERRSAARVDPNLGSMVAAARAGALDVLLTGDAESPVLGRLALRPVEVLKVSHHGSEDPGLAAVLGRLRPRAAVISAGAGNPFDHPRPGTLAALGAAGVPVWRTDRSGTVTLTATREGLHVATERGSGENGAP